MAVYWRFFCYFYFIHPNKTEKCLLDFTRRLKGDVVYEKVEEMLNKTFQTHNKLIQSLKAKAKNSFSIVKSARSIFLIPIKTRLHSVFLLMVSLPVTENRYLPQKQLLAGIVGSLKCLKRVLVL